MWAHTLGEISCDADIERYAVEPTQRNTDTPHRAIAIWSGCAVRTQSGCSHLHHTHATQARTHATYHNAQTHTTHVPNTHHTQAGGTSILPSTPSGQSPSTEEDIAHTPYAIDQTTHTTCLPSPIPDGGPNQQGTINYGIRTQPLCSN